MTSKMIMFSILVFGPSWTNVSNAAASYVIGSSLPSTQAVYYDRIAVDALYANLGFQDLTSEKSIPLKSGRTIQIYTPNLSPYTTGAAASAADTPPTPATDGTVGTPLIPTEASITAALGQYVDYTNISDFAEAVDIGKPLEMLSELLGYRGRLLVDTMIQQSFDAAIVTDGTCDQQVADANFMTRAVISVAVALIRGKNGKTFADGRLRGLIHPYILSDVANDLTANGVLDIEKHTREGQEWSEAGLVKSNQVIPIAGVNFVTTTNVPLLSNSPTTGKSSWCTYISAKETIFSVGLGGHEDVPDMNNFKASIYSFKPSAFDPGGQIAGAASFNFKFVATPRPGTVMPFRRVKAETAVA